MDHHGISRLIGWLLVGLVFVSMFVFVGIVATSAASAQEQQQNQTVPEEEIEDQLGDLVVHSYDYDGSTETMTIEASWQGRAPVRATLTEMIELESGGSTEISFQRVALTPDERTEITVSARQRTGGTAAILVTTPQSIEEGNALVLQDGDPSSYPSIRFQNVLLAIMLTSIGSAGAAFVFVLRKKHSENRGKERIA